MQGNMLGDGAVEWLGVWYKTLLSSDATEGRIAVVDSVSPAGSGPPRHVHKNADETFVVLTGECNIWIDGTTHYAGPGQSVFVPRGTEHAFRILGEQPSRHLVILTPGGFEGFFQAMAAGGYAIPQDMDTIARIGADYHLEFTGPPLGDGPQPEEAGR